MTREEITRMAREAGVRDDGSRFEFSEYKYLERFVGLVVAAEREACARICVANAEACNNNSMLRDVLAGNAAAIRARGEK